MNSTVAGNVLVALQTLGVARQAVVRVAALALISHWATARKSQGRATMDLDAPAHRRSWQRVLRLADEHVRRCWVIGRFRRQGQGNQPGVLQAGRLKLHVIVIETARPAAGWRRSSHAAAGGIRVSGAGRRRQRQREANGFGCRRHRNGRNRQPAPVVRP